MSLAWGMQNKSTALAGFPTLKRFLSKDFILLGK